MQQEAVIGGITPGSRKQIGALMLGVQSKLCYVGHFVTGFSDEMLKDILKRLTEKTHLTEGPW